MSRLRRLKERKIKNTIKATSCGLALALIMGSVQGLGTYALFTDTVDTINKLDISTGDVDVEVGKGFKGIKLEKGKEYKNEFDISNKGTLKQKLYIGFDYKGSNFPEGFLKKITYKLEIRYEGRLIDTIIKTGDLLNESAEEIEIKDKNSDFILDPDKKISCTAYIKLNHTNHSPAHKDDNFNFNLKIISKQIGLQTGGFFDVESQINEINFKNADESNGSIGICSCGCENKAIKLEFNAENLRPKDILDRIESISVFDESGNDMFSCHKLSIDKETGKGMVDMVKNYEPQIPIDETYLNGKIINIYFQIRGMQGYEKYSLLLGQSKPGEEITFKWSYAGPVDENLKPKKEIENQIESELIELPKKELEVEELPKKEVEVPGEPEVVEPPKEEVEVPIEPDVISPSKEETEIQE